MQDIQITFRPDARLPRSATEKPLACCPARKVLPQRTVFILETESKLTRILWRYRPCHRHDWLPKNVAVHTCTVAAWSM